MTKALFILFFTLLSEMISGCTFYLGDKKMSIRPGRQVLQRSVEQGDGEQITWESFKPEGDSVFIFFRGEL